MDLANLSTLLFFLLKLPKTEPRVNSSHVSEEVEATALFFNNGLIQLIGHVGGFGGPLLLGNLTAYAAGGEKPRLLLGRSGLSRRKEKSRMAEAVRSELMEAADFPEFDTVKDMDSNILTDSKPSSSKLSSSMLSKYITLKTEAMLNDTYTFANKRDMRAFSPSTASNNDLRFPGKASTVEDAMGKFDPGFAIDGKVRSDDAGFWKATKNGGRNTWLIVDMMRSVEVMEVDVFTRFDCEECRRNFVNIEVRIGERRPGALDKMRTQRITVNKRCGNIMKDPPESSFIQVICGETPIKGN